MINCARPRLDYRIVSMRSKLQIRAWSAIKEILQKNGTDLVHCHGARANWYGRLAARQAGVKTTFCTVHNSLKDYPYSAFRRRLYVTLEKQTAGWVSQWIAVSEAIRQDLINYYGLPADRIEVVRNGIDVRDLTPQRSRQQARRALGIEEEALVLVEIARMTRQKGHRFLVSAISRMISSFPDLKCLFAGDGPQRPILEKQIRDLDIEDHFQFLGFRSDVPDLVQTSDIYVLPSLSEGLPIGLLEAMALGSPVVASSVNGVPEVLQHGVNGLLVPPGDVNALLAALTQMASDPSLRERLAEAARKTVLDHFTAARTASRVAVLYRHQLEKS